LGLFLVYAILILYYERAWKNIPVFYIQQFDSLQANIKVSVIIPARNEEDQIGICLKSLLQQTYPRALLEIIVVNDHSTDNTEAVVKSFNEDHIKIINLAEHLDGKSLNAYKKKAIEIAIGAASGDLIVTTDADCTAPPDWIKCLAAFHHRYKAAFIAAPVKITSRPYLLSVFQSLDFITLQGITGASVHKKFHSMCNGANLAYEKKAFYEAGGFKGIDNIASGDDMLLMHKIFTLHPGRVFFLKSESAIVSTLPTHSWKAFFHQRVRWASKADKYEDKKMFGVLVLVYFFNVILLVFLLAGLWNLSWLLLFLLLIAAKTLLEFSFVRRVATFFRQQNLMIYFPFVQPLHILYTVIAGWLGKFGSYEWKGRKVY
jgi:cellulose synthase/poly-beta-1,6-N-acetylglucosamine synthase-like glycosyltransferase